MILTLVLCAALVLCALLAASGFTAIARARAWRDAARWDGPLLFTAAAVILLTVLGVLAPLPGTFLALAPTALVALTMVPSWRALAARDGKGRATRRVLAGLFGHARDSALNARDDARSLRSRKGGQPPAVPGQQRPPAAPPPTAPAPEGGTAPARQVPPLREDPVLAPVPEAAQVAAGLEAAGVQAPEPWAAVAAAIAQFEPEDDNDQSAFLHGNAAGLIAVAEAFHAHADHIVTAVGADPAYGQALLEFGDIIAAASADVALVDRRFYVIYGEIKAFVENGGYLPHDGRWISGGGPREAPGESAA